MSGEPREGAFEIVDPKAGAAGKRVMAYYEWGDAGNPQVALCEDGNPCTVEDACAAGRCVGVTRSCDEAGACRVAPLAFPTGRSERRRAGRSARRPT